MNIHNLLIKKEFDKKDTDRFIFRDTTENTYFLA